MIALASGEMQTHTDQRGEAAPATPQRQLLDGWRDVSSHLRKLAQALGDAQSCVCDDGSNDSCRCGVCIETQHECVQCAVLLHTVAWRIDELLDEVQRFPSTTRDVLSQSGEAESTTRMGAVQCCVEALARTFEQIETLTQEFSQGCSAACLPVIRRFADDLLIRCSALDEGLGFPRAASGRS
jgi:hypothetical protein